MCGRFNVIDSPEVQVLLRHLGIVGGQLRFTPDAAPGALISIVHGSDEGVVLTDAIWWLLLDPQTLKPNYKYASFNTRWDKLHSKQSLGYAPYRQRRCIIPASAFVEGLGDKKTYHKIELQDEAIAFGGLYTHYVNKHTGESAYAASIITLGALPQWQTIHPKSMPLMLPVEDKKIMDAWLDPHDHDVTQFEALLQPEVRSTQVVTPIGKPSKWDAIGPSWAIPPSANAD
ncbi:SOS response-associated peptidase family protein [Pseudohongiella acticola]|jgi:putative SOS response-associated peptidase YedK|uniref:SOS response-associated peptidase family protein n=1 Tax=Pseudohongiella acticola TaxID=1524254 RepID=UPI0030EBCA16